MSSRQSCAQCADMLRLAFKPQPQRYCAPNSACPVGRRGAVSSRLASTSASAPATSISTSTLPPKKSSNRKLLRDLKNEPVNSPSSPISHIANSLQSRASRTTETYTAFGATKKMFEACQLQADYKIPQASQPGGVVPKTAHGEDLGVGEGAWYKELGLLPTFSTWSQITFLHMYLLTVRLRALPSPESFRTYSQHLLDNFSHNAEHRMTIYHGMTMRGIRNRYLKDLFIQWRGVLAAYDQGLVSGDAVLGAAVWRNIWKASHVDPNAGGDGNVPEEMDWRKVAAVVGYMRRVLVELSRVPHEGLVDLVVGKKVFGLTRQDWGLAGTVYHLCVIQRA
ncbi:CBP3 protein [Histoplasma capsulatum H143]|uniref:CBP3 protein n=1 Tax=Ajellomyces capsulatus (strain H143) TaxID=544712 RepID=C6HT26_AJECH|nr:CBP3 protein [Histoplasma capsulatum H143]